MHLFKTLLSMELRLYKRGVWLWTVLSLLTVYLFQGYNLFIRDGLSTGQLVQSSSYIVMAGMLLGMISGVLNARRERIVHFEETESALPGYEWIPFIKLIAWGLIVGMLMLVSISEVLFMYWFSKSQLLLYWYQTVEYILVYWGATTMSAGILGYMLERLFKSKWTYLAMIPIWILTSPYNSMLLPKSVAYWLNQGEMNPNAIYNDYKGFEITIDVVCRHFFLFFVAIGLLVLSLLIGEVREMTQPFKRKMSVSSFLAIALAFSIVFVRSENVTYAEPNHNIQEFEFYHEFESKHPIIENYNTPLSFQVKSYQLDLVKSDENQLAYEANLIVSPIKGESDKEVIFTLYHQFEVSNVKVGNKTVNWKRDGDLLIVPPINGQQEISMNISLRGTPDSNTTLTNDALFLSSSFSWYPIPGKWRVAEGTPYGTLRFNQINSAPLIPFYVKVEGENQGIFSNLQKVGDNQFAGKATGITLMKGNLLVKSVQGHRIVAPPDLINKIPDLLPKIDESMGQLGKQLKTDIPTLPQNVFVVPMNVDSSFDAMILLPDQLQIDVSNVRRAYNKEESLFANPMTVLNGCFLYPKQKEHQAISSYLLNTIYDYLYMKTPLNRKTTLEDLATDTSSSKLGEVQSIAKRIVELNKQNKAMSLKAVLSKWYQNLEPNNDPTKTLDMLLQDISS